MSISPIKNKKAFIAKFINAFLISSGFFGVFFISAGYFGTPELRGEYGIFDLLFLVLYLLMFFYGIKGWVKNLITLPSKVFLFAQLITISLFGISYLFSGVIDLFITVTIKPLFVLGFELETGIRYKFIHDGQVDEITIGLNVVAVIYLVLLYYHEKE